MFNIKPSFIAQVAIVASCSGLLPVCAQAEVVPLSELYTQTAAERDALCYQTYRYATEKLFTFAQSCNKDSAGRLIKDVSTDFQKPYVKSMAVVLDLDETVVNNHGYQNYMYREGVGYTPQSWSAWCEYQAKHPQAAPLVPGAKEYIEQAENLGYTVFYVSNRYQRDKGVTIELLDHLGINTNDIETRMLLRPESEVEKKLVQSWAKRLHYKMNDDAYRALAVGEGKKQRRRYDILQRYHIAQLLGDQMSDFTPYLGKLAPEGVKQEVKDKIKHRRDFVTQNKNMLGDRWFILPNSLYGYWGVGNLLPVSNFKNVLTDYGFAEYLKEQ